MTTTDMTLKRATDLVSVAWTGQDVPTAELLRAGLRLTAEVHRLHLVADDLHDECDRLGEELATAQQTIEDQTIQLMEVGDRLAVKTLELVNTTAERDAYADVLEATTALTDEGLHAWIGGQS